MVHGAVKARLRLGFDTMSDNEYNLKPIIRDLQQKVGVEHFKPLITTTAPNSDPIGARNQKMQKQIPIYNIQDFNQGQKMLALTSQQADDAQMKKMEAQAFVKKLKQDKLARERQIKMQLEAKDSQFLSKLNANLMQKKKVEEMKKKERELKYQMM